MLIVSKTRESVNQQSGQPDEMGLDGYGCPVTEQRVVVWERLTAVDWQSCGCVLLVCLLPEGMLLLLSSSGCRGGMAKE